MKSLHLAPLAAVAFLVGCVTPVGPVEVTRFHTPDAAALVRSAIAVEAAPGMDGASLEQKTYQTAVAQQLRGLGYPAAESGAGDQVAQVKFSRSRYRADRVGSPVSVGIGGSTGSYGSGLGLGIGIDLSGPPPEQVETQLGVIIRDRKSNTVLWEGRARFVVSAKSPLADTALGAPKVAEALFRGFPGNSGETIEVK